MSLIKKLIVLLLILNYSGAFAIDCNMTGDWWTTNIYHEEMELWHYEQTGTVENDPKFSESYDPDYIDDVLNCDIDH